MRFEARHNTKEEGLGIGELICFLDEWSFPTNLVTKGTKMRWIGGSSADL
jgi:hypothetical protein